MTSVFSRKGAKSSAGGCACREVGWGSVSPRATHLHIGSFNFPEVTKIQGPIYMLTSWKHTSLLPPLPVIAVRDQCVCWLICLFLPWRQRLHLCPLPSVFFFFFQFLAHSRNVILYIFNCLTLPWNWLSDSWHEWQHFFPVVGSTSDNVTRLWETDRASLHSRPWKRVNTSPTSGAWRRQEWSPWIFSTSETGKLKPGEARCLSSQPTAINHHNEIEMGTLSLPRLRWQFWSPCPSSAKRTAH